MAAKKKGKRPAAKKSTAKKSTAKKSTAKSTASSPVAAASGERNPTSAEGGISSLTLGIGVLVAGVLAFAALRVDGQPADEEVAPVEVGGRPAPPHEEASLGTTIPEPMQVRVVAEHPHARNAFTQGLLWHAGRLYESTGLRGESSVRRVALDSGEVEHTIDVPPRYFAEGLARVEQRLYQLTWQSGRAFVYDLEDFTARQEFSYEGEGWGLCFDGEHLVMSDGSSTLTFRDPETFEVVREVEVTKVGRPLRRLNELECVSDSEGYDGVWANVWMTEEIVRIDPRTGRVLATVDASGLLTRDERRGVDVLNGIAWLPERGRFAITGKHWPKLFEVEFVPR